MEFSLFGEKFTRHAGITQLMDDLNQGLLNPDAIMLGGGNPAPIPAMLERFQAEANTLLDNGELIIKRLHKQYGRIKLLSSNPTYPAIVPKEGESVDLWGVVTASIKQFRV